MSEILFFIFARFEPLKPCVKCCLDYPYNITTRVFFGGGLEEIPFSRKIWTLKKKSSLKKYVMLNTHFFL